MLRHHKNEVVGLSSAGIGNATAPQLAAGSNTMCNSAAKSMATAGSGSPLDALPKQFVISMKTLFDILDDHQTGYVKFSDIEKGWQDDGCKGLPKGVINSLRKVTPASGLLSFERFCAGLKLCLLRNQAKDTTITPSSVASSTTATINAATSGPNTAEIPTSALHLGNTPHVKGKSLHMGNTFLSSKCKSNMKQARPPSAPLLAIENPLPSTPWNPPAAAIRPCSSIATQRTLSMPQLSPQIDAPPSGINVYNSPPPPPKPPRAAAAAGGILSTAGTASVATSSGQNGLDKAQIRHALQNWQMNILLNEMDAKDMRKSSYVHYQIPPYRGCADGSSSSATDSAVSNTIVAHAKKPTNKRREPRRHTLQNGIDYNMLKRSKQFEEEREMLLIGLDAVEKARNWYLRQLANVQEKIKYLRMGTQEQWSEVQQERLNFQRARVLEVNRNLAVLTDTWERGGFPTHFNLAIRTTNKSAPPRSVVQSADRLRHQNRHLIDEVNLKSERITLLEREKQTLIHDLYELQQRVGGLGERGSRFVNVLSQPSPVCSSSSGGLGDADVVY